VVTNIVGEWHTVAVQRIDLNIWLCIVNVNDETLGASGSLSSIRARLVKSDTSKEIPS
jgi:hypothetical protein